MTHKNNPKTETTIEPCTSIDQPGWLNLRQALWPHCSAPDHIAEISALLSQPGRYAQFMAYSATNQPVGFVEVSLRLDYVNGTQSSPVAFIEGLYVDPEYRCLGIARRLVDEASCWAVQQDCREIASDTTLDNILSQTVHKALGFEETERVIFFRKPLTRK